MNPYQEIEKLKEENDQLRHDNEELRKDIRQFKEDIKTLVTKVLSLEERISGYEKPKNSRNSSIPPSHDYTRSSKARSLRESSGRKPGGQPGHQGINLEMNSNPDQIIPYIPQYCTCCGLDISQIQAEFVEKRQEIVLPVIKPICVEHQIFRRTCICG